ncbi:hypothetical protein [Methanosarcina acetivorans]|uniref:hypothetical protein n=1 Tax=Methanosarcina acetivorans TaxID=2214 RepID=UPI001D03B9C7|nr:hypothetical protein [Methanosarcina acetivorans]
MYLLSPVIGAFLGLIFCITIRGGIYQQTTTIQQTSAFVFVAISTLAGLFSVQSRIQDSR